MYAIMFTLVSRKQQVSKYIFTQESFNCHGSWWVRNSKGADKSMRNSEITIKNYLLKNKKVILNLNLQPFSGSHTEDKLQPADEKHSPVLT